MLLLEQIAEDYKRFALYEKGHRPATVRQALSLLRKLCAHTRKSKIAEIDTPAIRSFLIMGREIHGWSAKSFRIYRQSLKTFFDWAMMQNLVSANPVSAIGQPPLPQILPRCLSQSQALSILAHVRWHPWHYELEQYRNEAIIATFLFAGLRLSELINLKANEVNIGNEELFVRSGKNSKDRVVPLHHSLQRILQNYIAAFQRLGRPSVWFFPSVKSEKRLTNKNVQAIFSKISTSIGFKVTPHMLRHTFGRLCVESGVNLRVIQTLMGHSDIRTTQIYTFVSTQTTRESLRLLNLC